MEQTYKNTVSSENQLKNSDKVTFGGSGGSALKVLFVGNSITRHGISPGIGWHRDCGMAASSEENDYVHILKKRILEKYPDARFCISQVADWERTYAEPDKNLEMYKDARDFGADIIIMRIIENCPVKDFDAQAFYRGYLALIDYFNASGNARVILTTGFWRHPGDSEIRRAGKERGYPVVELGHLGDDDSMKATGLFEHQGVASHPGDKGMLAIADAIGKELGL